MGHDEWWRVALAVGMLLFFGASGVYVALRPDRFMTRPLMWRQGEMERTMNRDGVRLVGVALTALSVWIIYELLSAL